MNRKKTRLKGLRDPLVVALLEHTQLLLESDLCDPAVERAARENLKALRAKGVRFANLDLEDPDCLPCLFETLMSAVGDEIVLH
jgi:hypothetical protein